MLRSDEEEEIDEMWESESTINIDGA